MSQCQPITAPIQTQEAGSQHGDHHLQHLGSAAAPDIAFVGVGLRLAGASGDTDQSTALDAAQRRTMAGASTAASDIGRVSTDESSVHGRILSDFPAPNQCFRAASGEFRPPERVRGRVERAQPLGRADVGPVARPARRAEAALGDGGVEVGAQACPGAGLQSPISSVTKPGRKMPMPDQVKLRARPADREAVVGDAEVAARMLRRVGHHPQMAELAGRIAPAAAAPKSKPGANTSAATYQNGVVGRECGSGKVFLSPPAVSSAPPWSRPSSE